MSDHPSTLVSKDESFNISMKESIELVLWSLKKTLDTGLFVGKNVPKLIVTLGKSSKDLLTFAKANEMDTSGADDIELDFE